jgi:hypothetical protein
LGVIGFKARAKKMHLPPHPKGGEAMLLRMMMQQVLAAGWRERGKEQTLKSVIKKMEASGKSNSHAPSSQKRI